MNIATMRQAIADAYPRRTWKTKVKTMPDDQVFAVYKSMEREGRLRKHDSEFEARMKVPDLEPRYPPIAK